jgi:hypothetical protein
MIRTSHPKEGRLAIVTKRAVGCGGRGSVGRAGIAGRFSVSDQLARWTNGVASYGKAVWSWHPLLVLNWRRFCGPDRVRQDLQSADDGDKTNSSPGRARNKPLKPLRREGRVNPVDL